MDLNLISAGFHGVAAVLWTVCAVRSWRLRDPVARRRAAVRRA
ncbi:hypothetical protein ACFWJ5_02520 [Streptomyces qaidamensis]